MAAGGWAVIAFGSGVAGLSVLCPHPHSTHDPMLALPVLLVPHAQVLDEFGLTWAFCSSPRVAEHPMTANSRPLHCCAFSRRGIASRFCLLHFFWLAVVPNSE